MTRRITSLALVALSVMPVFAQNAQQSGVRSFPGARTTFSKPGLVINEISPGPMLSYIELYNGKSVSVDLDGYTIESSTGTVALDGLGAELGPGEYFVLLQGHPSEVGVSSNPEILCIVVSEPVCGHVTDTVLLRRPDGRIRDAATYGIGVDPSVRYSEAVLHGQFADQTYTSIAGQYEEVVIGRDRTGTDTNTVSNWDVLGGPDALIGSPFADNTGLPTDEDVWTVFFQSYLSTVVRQECFDLSIVTGSVSNFAAGGYNSTVDHLMVFQGDILGAGDWMMTGQVTNSLDLLPGGRYSMTSTGTLQGVGGRSITFTARREVGGAESLTSFHARVDDGVSTFPYDLVSTRSFSGVRGNYDVAIARDLTQWTGVTKTTSGLQHVDWLLASNGVVASNQSSATITRPYPLSDGPVGSTPQAVITTETLEMDTTTVATASGLHMDWTKLEFHYANSIPDVVGSNFTSDKVTLLPLGGAVQDILSGDFVAGGNSVPFHSITTTTAIPGQKLVNWTNTTTAAGQVLYSANSTYDPPCSAGDFWESVKSGFEFGAKVVASGATFVVGGVGCAATTAGGAALGGVTSVASLGVATLPGLAAAAGGAGACLALGTGAAYVVSEIWSQ